MDFDVSVRSVPFPDAGMNELSQRMLRHDVPSREGHVTWRCLGEGTPLVLLHGGHGNWAHWVRNIEALSQSFRVCVPDLPGYGMSCEPALPTLTSLLAATQETLDALVGAATPIALAGFSFGGLVAAHLAKQRLAVTALALLGAVGHGSPRRPRGNLLAWREAHAAKDQEALRQVMQHNLHMHMLAAAPDDLAVAIHTEACVRTRFYSRHISSGGGLAACLDALTCPVLLLWGEHDVTATPMTLAPLLKATCRDAHAQVLEGAGHWVQYEASEQVNDLLSAWFAPPRDDSAHCANASGRLQA